MARSDIKLLVRLGAKVKVISPKSLTPLYNGGVEIYHNFEQGLKNADAVIVLRVQKERMDGFFIPSFQDYACNYKLTHERLKFAKKGCFVLHPAPINRDVEIDSDLADDLDISLILLISLKSFILLENNGLDKKYSSMVSLLFGSYIK